MSESIVIKPEEECPHCKTTKFSGMGLTIHKSRCYYKPPNGSRLS